MVFEFGAIDAFSKDTMIEILNDDETSKTHWVALSIILNSGWLSKFSNGELALAILALCIAKKCKTLVIKLYQVFLSISWLIFGPVFPEYYIF
ncbi:MAG: hypothetical protein QME64_09420 [bacterium]|nr:hypothetical protein [bacterium]